MNGRAYEELGLQCSEGVASMWHYHLRKPGCTRALCGAPVMGSGRPLGQWGIVPPNYHLPESFCSACEQKADNR